MTANTQKITVRAIDLGYGYTKFSKEVNAKGEAVYDSFPSIAVRRYGSSELGTEVNVNTDVVPVEYDGEIYLGGKEIHLKVPSDSDPRILHDDYIEDPHYMALHYVAFSYMDVEEIDYLVVGMPVSLMHRKAKIVELLKGTHKIGAGKTVTVKEVIAMPQPMGGLMNLILSSDKDAFADFQEEQTLVIDPGYQTFDWLLSEGLKPMEARSGSYSGGGMSKILAAIIDDMSTKDVTKGRYKNVEKLDKGLRTGKFNLPGQKNYDLSKHKDAADSIVREAINKMVSSAGDGSDIDNIILVGGPSKFFIEALKKVYGDHDITVLEDPRMSNVEGYLKSGMRRAQALAKQGGDKKITFA